MKQTIFSWWFAKCLLYLAVASVLFASVLGVVLARVAAGAGSDNSPAWAMPDAMAIRRVSASFNTQGEPNFLNNLDCTSVTYRLVASSTMRTGCFTETAFGLLDSTDSVVIFNGTDEGLPLLPYTPHQVLAPWPKAMDLISLDPVDTGGTLVSLYKNPLAAFQDQRNLLAQLTAKQLVVPPDITLKDPSGKPLVINPQTIAFSDSGSWMVAETLGGSFVRINLATLAMTAFAPAYGSQGSPALLKSRVAVSDDGQFVAIANDVAGAFKVYDLATCNGLVNNLQPQACQSYDYRPFAQQQITGLQSVGHLRFVNEGLVSFEVTANNPAASGSYELAPAGSITSLTDYIGLGDSYTSGEGAFDYITGTDTPDNMCHVSRNSYPLLLAQDLFGSSGGHSVACSGAVINDIGSTSGNYRGQARGVANLQQLQLSQPLVLASVEADFLPGYVAQQRFVGHWQPRIATVSVGGNDIGFGSILQNCVEPHVSRNTSENTCYNTYEDRLEVTRLVDRTIPRWTALYKQLRHEAPDMQLYVIGYPQIAVDTGNCSANVQLNKSELAFASGMIDYLDQAMRKAAIAAEVHYVDTSQALAGHRLCETASYNVAVNGLTAGTDAGFLGAKFFDKESYHPNAFGQLLIEQAILKQTHNLDGLPSTGGGDTVTDSSQLLNAPKTGRVINTLVPDNNVTSGVGRRGSSVSVQASGANDGLQANTTYTVHLDGPAGTVLGTIASDIAGNVDGSVTIPVNTVPGGHTVDVTGEGQDGEPVDVTQPIYIPASDADSDGDGIDDIMDSCPGAINSGQDSDADGIDDVCDNLIGSITGSDNSGSPKGNNGPESQNENANAGSQGGNTDSVDHGGGSIKLNPAAVSVVAGFDTRGTPPPAAVGGSSPVMKSSSNNHVLGVRTITPNTTSLHATGAPNTKNGTKRGGAWPGLRIIYWLPWLILMIALWSIVLCAEKYIQTAEFRLQ